MDTNILLQKFQNLPLKIQQEIVDFIDFLWSRYKRGKIDKKRKNKFSFDWESGLKNKFSNINSVELQHLANKLR